MTSVDPIVEFLDNALQAPAASHVGFGDKVPDGKCCRCTDHAQEDDRGLCGGCRAFLLGDSDDDPATHKESEAHPVFGYAYFMEDLDGAPAWAATILEEADNAHEARLLAHLRPMMLAYLHDLGRRRRLLAEAHRPLAGPRVRMTTELQRDIEDAGGITGFLDRR